MNATRVLAAVVVLFSGAAQPALATPDYAWQWPLNLEREEAGAFRVELSAEHYQAAVDARLADIDVLAADGQPVPAALLSPSAQRAEAESRLELPWFALPASAPAGSPQRWRIRTETGPDRRLQRVETELLEAGAELPPLTDLLVDASSAPARILALELHWAERDSPLDARYRLDYSDDLENWQTAREGRLLESSNAGYRIVQRRIDTGAAAGARYLRLQPLDPRHRIEAERVVAVLAPNLEPARFEWVELAGERSEADGRVYLQFQSPGRYPVERIDLLLPANSAGQWSLESRDGDSAPWQPRLPPAVAYRLDDADGHVRSAERPLPSRIRDRQWRLVAQAPSRDSPGLKLGYRPESLVFLAQGQGPWLLVAGSAQARRSEAPVQTLLAAQHSRHGPDWQPAAAVPGLRSPRAGDAALRPAAEPRNWTAWLLWGVLVLAAALVGGMALSLLRRASGAGQQP
ncbi:MAG: DUF3999 domain-containing protein [Aquimonas sp.]|nr:DUF3999 domain-containing protein [Aquimonas sp.]